MLGKELCLTITGLARSGAGVGFYTFDTPRAVFVEKTAPGDVVRARITTQRKAYFEAELLEIITPSPSRRTPACPHFVACGACDWLHVTYEEQVRQKEQLLRHAFAKQRLPLPAVRVVPAAQEYWYRCKVRFPGNGFSARKSNTIIPVATCHLLHPAFQELLPKHHRKWECWGLDENGTITQGEARYRLGKQTLAYDPSGFVQANFGMHQELVAAVVAAAGEGPVLELYAGNGHFTVPLAERGLVVAVEGDPRSYALLKKNTAGASGVTMRNEDVREFLEHHEGAYASVVLDPPRAGVGEAIEHIGRLTSTIVYVSCDPDALARDAKLLVALGFRMEQATLLDLFPQTRHFESVARFVRP